MIILMAISKKKRIAYYMNDDKYYYFSWLAKQPEEIDEDEAIEDIANNDFDQVEKVNFETEQELLAYIKSQFKKKRFWQRKNN